MCDPLMSLGPLNTVLHAVLRAPKINIPLSLVLGGAMIALLSQPIDIKTIAHNARIALQQVETIMYEGIS
jgi:hypothetical protein